MKQNLRTQIKYHTITLLLFGGVATALVAWGAGNKPAFAAETLSVSPSAVFCDQDVTFSATGMLAQGSGFSYNLILTCTTGACTGNAPLNIGMPREGTSGTFTVRYNIDGQCSSGTQSITGGTYRVDLQKVDGVGTGVNVASSQVTFNSEVPRECQLTAVPPNTVNVRGTLGFNYTVRVNNIAQPGLAFTITTPVAGSPFLGTHSFNVDPSLFTPGSNIVSARATNPSNPSDAFDCLPSAVFFGDDPVLSINKAEATCGDTVSFTASHLFRDYGYKVEMECIENGGGTTGGGCTIGSKITVADITIPHDDAVVTNKQFNINNGCGGGEAAGAGLYRVRLTDELGNVAASVPFLRLSFSLGCTISGQEDVLIVNGNPQSDGIFDITAGPSTTWGIFINNTFFRSVNIPASGKLENIAIPKTYINTTLGPGNSANNLIRATKVGAGGQVTACEGNFQSYSLAWDCQYIDGDVTGNCSKCGEGRRCGPSATGSGGRCVPNTDDYCTDDGTEPTLCNMSDPCGSCGTREICDLDATTNTLYCRTDLENVCGEFYTYEQLGGLDYGTFGTFEEFLNALRGILIPLGIVIGMAFLLICGYKFMTSQGQPDKLRDAKECLTSAIIGLLVVLLSVSIINTLINLAIKLT